MRPRDLRVDEPAAREVAAWYVDRASTPRDPLVRAAYAALESQTDVLLRRLLGTCRRGAVRVVSTVLAEPYDGDRDLADAVATTRTLEVPRTRRDRRHPLLDTSPGGAYDRLRAFHDLLGHVAAAFGFDRDGELAAWLVQDRCYRGLARAALATELHGQHSVLWSTGELAVPKAIPIDRRLVQSSVAAAVTRRAGARPPHGGSG
jgi:hypothetical protein